MRRVPHASDAEPAGQARARVELDAEQGCERLDVQAAAERQVPERRNDDGSRCHRDVQAAARSYVAGPLGIQGRALTEWNHAGRRRPDGGVQARRADRQLPVPDELDDVPGDHPAGELRAGDLRHEAPDDRRLSADGVLARSERHLRAVPRMVGRNGTAGRRRWHLLLHGCSGRRGLALGQPRSVQRHHARVGSAALQQLVDPDLRDALRWTSRALHARRPAAVQRLPGSPGGCAHASIALD